MVIAIRIKGRNEIYRKSFAREVMFTLRLWMLTVVKRLGNLERIALVRELEKN